jgi:hypothetical protein
MNILRSAVLQAILVLFSGAWATGAHADELCDRLRSLEWSASPRPSEPGRRWIELHWQGHWLDFDRGFGFACSSSADPEAKALCHWLTGHTNFEFADVLPMQILECYGYRFPHPYPYWDGWKGNVSIGHGHYGELEVNFSDLKGETGAIRFSLFAPKHSDYTDELPSLTAMPQLPPPAKN